MVTLTAEEYSTNADRYRLLEQKIDASSLASSIARIVGPFAWDTLTHLQSPHKGTATIMAVTACRWGELERLDLPDLLVGYEIYWQPTKGSAPRRCRIDVPASELHTARLSASTPPHVVQYPAHSRAVRLAARQAGVEPSGPSLKATHVWRHLRAWHMISQGYPIEQISLTLGHRMPQSTEHYVRSMPAHVRELIHS